MLNVCKTSPFPRLSIFVFSLRTVPNHIEAERNLLTNPQYMLYSKNNLTSLWFCQDYLINFERGQFSPHINQSKQNVKVSPLGTTCIQYKLIEVSRLQYQLEIRLITISNVTITLNFRQTTLKKKNIMLLTKVIVFLEARFLCSLRFFKDFKPNFINIFVH